MVLMIPDRGPAYCYSLSQIPHSTSLCSLPLPLHSSHPSHLLLPPTSTALDYHNFDLIHNKISIGTPVWGADTIMGRWTVGPNSYNHTDPDSDPGTETGAGTGQKCPPHYDHSLYLRFSPSPFLSLCLSPSPSLCQQCLGCDGHSGRRGDDDRSRLGRRAEG